MNAATPAGMPVTSHSDGGSNPSPARSLSCRHRQGKSHHLAAAARKERALISWLSQGAPSSCKEPAVIITVGAGTFVFALQVTSILVALPTMARFLHRPLSTEWAATTYLLCLTAFLLLFGRLGDCFGTKRFYIAGLVIFTSASLLCAIAQWPFLFLVGRSLQGIGAAMSAANSPAILTRHTLPERRGCALGWQATMTYLGLAVGPVSAAFLVTHFTWRAIFFFNIPFGLAAIGFALYALPASLPRARHLSDIPVISTTLWLGCLVPLVLTLSQGVNWGWTSLKTVGLLIMSALSCFLFYKLNRRSTAQFPITQLIDLSLFKDRLSRFAVFYELFFYFGIYAIGFFIPALLIRGLGRGVTAAAAILTTQTLARLFIAPVAGIASDRHGSTTMISLGAALLGLGAILLACLTDSGPLLPLGFAAALIGLGSGVFVPANSARLFANSPLRQHGSAAGALATARNLGMLLGITVAAAVCSNSFSFGRVKNSAVSGSRLGLSFVSLTALTMLFINLFLDEPLAIVETSSPVSAFEEVT
jgi:MFS family permease